VLAELEGDESLPPAARFTSVAAFDRLLGLDLAAAAGGALPAGAEELIARREQARVARDFGTADRLREELAALGVEIADTRAGTTWRLRRPS
jgi:cysteinyl-tRNA synthetase